MRERLDKLIVEKNILKSREKAQTYIMCGNITVNGETVRKPATLVNRSAQIKILQPNEGYVGRGGIKLEGALTDFRIHIDNTYCLDIGASTGGFTDCLLKKGAWQVIALDVGKNQLDYRLRIDSRVKVIEKFNARYIDRLKIEKDLDIVTLDVSFISIKLVLTALLSIINKRTRVIALIKPQFELDKPYEGFRGVVDDRNIHRKILRDLHNYFQISGYDVRGYTFSPIKGPKGNIEYFVYLMKSTGRERSCCTSWNGTMIDKLVDGSHDYFQKVTRG